MAADTLDPQPSHNGRVKRGDDLLARSSRAPGAAARCGYLVDWVTVKAHRYEAVDDIERDALVREAEACPGLPIATTPADTPQPSRTCRTAGGRRVA